MKNSKQLELMSLPTSQLLDKFGAGSHKPGSGSAAALMGILAGKLLVTVGRLTLKKDQYRENHREVEFIIQEFEGSIEPELRNLFDEDARVFDEVIRARIARDRSNDPRSKRRHSERALAKLREATDIPLRICELCLRLIDYGVAMFDLGFKGARGDSGAGISAAVAGAMAAIFVTNLNLRSFRAGQWLEERRRKAEHLHQTLVDRQLEAFAKVSVLKEEEFESQVDSLFDLPEV